MPQARITILLCTYNGVRHLPTQLQSYLNQQDEDWDLWVSDDGSSDGTLAILEAFRAEQAGRHEVRLIEGPGRGFAANFLSLLCHPDLPDGMVALSDQDDVWLPEKLALARAALQGAGVAVYGGQSLHVAEDLTPFGRSRPPRRGPSFGNALAQNIVSGHSATLSAAGLALVRQVGVVEVTWHDWWLYQIIAGAGGRVVIDAAPVLLYRQHGRAAMGAHRGLRASMARIGQVMGRDYGGWIAANLAALDQAAPLLTAENRALVQALRATPPGPRRALRMMKGGVHRQGRLTTGFLWLAALLGRV